jgi:hypothetical protein
MAIANKDIQLFVRILQGKEGLDTMRPRPFIYNHVVELLEPYQPKGTCYVEVKLLRDGKKWAMSGWYNDEYAKVGGNGSSSHVRSPLILLRQ